MPKPARWPGGSAPTGTSRASGRPAEGQAALPAAAFVSVPPVLEDEPVEVLGFPSEAVADPLSPPLVEEDEPAGVRLSVR